MKHSIFIIFSVKCLIINIDDTVSLDLEQSSGKFL